MFELCEVSHDCAAASAEVQRLATGHPMLVDGTTVASHSLRQSRAQAPGQRGAHARSFEHTQSGCAPPFWIQWCFSCSEIMEAIALQSYSASPDWAQVRAGQVLEVDDGLLSVLKSNHATGRGRQLGNVQVTLPPPGYAYNPVARSAREQLCLGADGGPGNADGPETQPALQAL